MAIDYGNKRCGIAVTDPLQIIATTLGTVHTLDLMNFVKDYTAKEKTQTIVVGEPKRMNNQASDIEQHITGFCRKLKKEIPSLEVVRWDERFTSKIAGRTLVEMGAKKKDRMTKENTDSISAVIILQSYLENLQFKKTQI
jgi:putative Holliday junction resolvase